MDSTFWPLVTVAIIIIIFGIFVIAKYRGKEFKTDYYALFLVGLFWMAIGLSGRNHSISLLGLIFFAIGLSKKKEWKENHRSWHQLSSKEKKIKLILIAVIIVLIAVAIGIMTMRELNGKN